MMKKSNCVEGLPVENKNVFTFSLTRPYLAGSEAPSVPELLQYASDQDCLSLQLVQLKVPGEVKGVTSNFYLGGGSEHPGGRNQGGHREQSAQ